MSLPNCEKNFHYFKNKNVAKYGGGNPIDPDTTTEDLILTQKNIPGAKLFYVITFFYNSVSTNSNRAQIAVRI